MQYVHVFANCLEELKATPTGAGKNDMELMHLAVLEYNKTVRATNCKVDGDERLAVINLFQWGEAVQSICIDCWNDYKVRESPLTQRMLASNVLKMKLPDGVFPMWIEFMQPTKEKLPTYFERVCTTFSSKVQRAHGIQGSSLQLRTSTSRFKEVISEEMIFAAMCWASWTTMLQSLVPPQRHADLNHMYMRGSLDDMIIKHMRMNESSFKAGLVNFARVRLHHV